MILGDLQGTAIGGLRFQVVTQSRVCLGGEETGLVVFARPGGVFEQAGGLLDQALLEAGASVEVASLEMFRVEANGCLELVVGLVD